MKKPIHEIEEGTKSNNEKEELIRLISNQVSLTFNKKDNTRPILYLIRKLATEWGAHGLSITLDTPEEYKNESRVLIHARYTQPSVSEMIENFSNGIHTGITFSLGYKNFITISYNREKIVFTSISM